MGGPQCRSPRGLPPHLQVRALKEKIEAEKGSDAFPVAGQKLIYAGKILSDDVPICEYRIDEKNFVVVMVTKVRTPPPPLPLPHLRPVYPLTPPSPRRPRQRWAPQLLNPRLLPLPPQSPPRPQRPPPLLTPSPPRRLPPVRSSPPRTSPRSPSRSLQRGKGEEIGGWGNMYGYLRFWGWGEGAKGCGKRGFGGGGRGRIEFSRRDLKNIGGT